MEDRARLAEQNAGVLLAHVNRLELRGPNEALSPAAASSSGAGEVMVLPVVLPSLPHAKTLVDNIFGTNVSFCGRLWRSR